jgi:hypothetical protein
VFRLDFGKGFGVVDHADIAWFTQRRVAGRESGRAGFAREDDLSPSRRARGR